MVLPIVREVLETSNDVCLDIDLTIAKYAPGQPICEGLNFNFAMLYLYGIPKLWQIFTISNLAKQKEIIQSLKLGADGKIENLKEVLFERLGAHEPRYENHHDLFARVKIIKQFMREYITANPLDNSKQEKYGIVAHSRVMATMTAASIGENDELVDYYWMQNCEMRPFNDY